MRLKKLRVNFILFLLHLSYDLLKLACTLLIYHSPEDKVYIDEFLTVLINDSTLLSEVSIQLRLEHNRTKFGWFQSCLPKEQLSEKLLF